MTAIIKIRFSFPSVGALPMVKILAGSGEGPNSLSLLENEVKVGDSWIFRLEPNNVPEEIIKKDGVHYLFDGHDCFALKIVGENVIGYITEMTTHEKPIKKQKILYQIFLSMLRRQKASPDTR